MLDPLGPGGTRRFRRVAFDHHVDARVIAPEEVAAPDAILLLDGLFLHRDELHRLWDFSVFLDVAFAESVARCARRDAAWPSPDVRSPANRRYVAGQRLYLARCDPQRRASRVVDNTDLALPRIAR